MKKLILTLLIACAALSAFPLNRTPIAPDLLRAAAQQPAPVTADSDLILVDDITRIRYEADGTYVYFSDSAFKILTEKGRQEKSTVSIGYDKAYGTARFTLAQIIKPDGRIIPVNLASQSRESIDQGQMNANIYDPNSKTVKLTIPDLEIGDVLRYTVEGERTKTVVPDTWSDIFTFEDTFPILHASCEIDAPAERPLVRIELRDEIPGTVQFGKKETRSRILYRWEAANVPRMYEEPDMPQAYTVVQRLLVSTIPDWETLSKWYWELSKPRLDTVNSNMIAKVQELTEGLTNRQDRISAIFRFVSQDVRYMGITVEDEAPGYEPHNVCMTFDNRYGVCRDKAALLVSMLSLAGFEARPVLIYVGPKKDPDVPQPWFNHAITAVRNEDGSWQLMDATNENTRDLLPAYLSNRSYLVATPKGETLQTSAVVPPEQNMLTIDVSAALDGDWTISGTAELHFSGINDTAYRGRLAGLKPEEREPYFEERLKQAFGNARLLRLDITPEDVRNTTVPLSVRLRFETENALADGPDDAVLQVPTLVNHFGLFGRLIGDGIGLDKRRYPLQVQVTCGVRETVKLDLSHSGLHPSVLPDYEPVDTPELTIRRNVSADGDLLTGTATILLKTVEFSPEQYQTLKQNLKVSERNARKRVILAHDEFPVNADLAVMNEKVVYTLADSNHWKEERTLRRKVLTYAGKREAADLKLAYNPAIQNLTLDYAAVTAPDGTVRRIDPTTEINRMDAGWCSEAPRYPAEKIMVANLPGVEIGSVIETRTTCVYSNLPFFSTIEPLAGFAPVASKTVQIRAPHALEPALICTGGNINRISYHDGDWTVYEWKTAHQPMIKKEAHLPPLWITAPALFASTGDREAFAKRVGKVLTGAAGSRKLAAKKAKELTAGLDGREQKITALRDFVDRTVRTAGPGFSALPLSAVTPADRTLADGYGNSTDRAVLLYAMLDAVKLAPQFILTSNLPRNAQKDVPVLAALQRAPFDSILVAVDIGKKKRIFLGDSGQYAQLGTLEHKVRPAINLSSGAFEFPQVETLNSTETAYILKLFENGDAAVTRKEVFSGTEFEAFHKQFAQFTPEERRRELQSLLSSVSQSAQADGDLKTSFDDSRMEFKAYIPSFAQGTADSLYFTLPEGLGGLLDLKASRRESPFYIENPVNRVFIYEIGLPAGWKVAVSPEPFRIDLPTEAGFVEVRIARGKDRFYVVQQAHIMPTVIPPEDYGQLLLLHDRLTAPDASTILLRKP
jgi:transglutaminase-like putative cysteine protease